MQPSPRALRKSFLTVVVGEKPPVIPPSRNSCVYKDRPVATFYENEIEILARPFSDSLVGKFNRMPKLQEIRQAFRGIVWISFSNLKARLYEKAALLLIAKTIGKPLYVDEATANGSRPSVTRGV
ncbi:Uncharacterized protein TCM_045949 [Theobroma cacao]|uniref:Uncharacterized protein n=1 Tax=Theobroma cacao TaxID=3641 RepID=S1SI69_THECC|nr:Uncharacterized protein TCM_045949 [Theobroma cacao]